MNVPSPDEFSLEMLAAYADGELDADGCALVERWLTAHPEAMKELRTQRELSPTNYVLWEAAEPLQPTAEAWVAVRQQIEAESTTTRHRTADRYRGLRVAGLLVTGLTLTGSSAAMLWVAFISSMQQPKSEPPTPTELANTKPHSETAPAPHTPQADPLATIAVLEMPTDDEVILDRVPTLSTGWLPVGRHPVPGMLTLATVEELTLEEVSPSRLWSTSSGPKMTTAPGDAPMIFAAKPR